MTFTQKDLTQIANKGMTVTAVEEQINNFKTGFPFANIQKAATIGDGILQISEAEQKKYVDLYNETSKALDVYKFVPASGAASRMFKQLFAFMENYKGTAQEEEAFLADKSSKSMYAFFNEIKDFAFYNDLKAVLVTSGENIETLLENKDYTTILKALLTEAGLNYGNLPKGLLKFHAYDKSNRTPLEEHLVEGANYCKGDDGKVYLHFTVSPSHREKFLELIDEVKADYEKAFDCKFIITLSEQHSATDTIAVNMDNTPFRKGDESILFRPGGHGALLQNVNDLKADLVFVKNIDNVVPDRIKAPTYQYKQVLGGVLLSYQSRIFDFLKGLEGIETASADTIKTIETFFTSEICFAFPAEYNGLSDTEKTKYLFTKLNRPIKVCGMVKNEGEPGGGPFWTLNSDGTTSLQIIESAQIDTKNEVQSEIMQNSSHFNPVDLACGLRNYKGEDFDLLKFRDPNTGFIVYKSSDGKELKAQELPGLWNGAMADWNTLFVEVPIITFNPVKVVQDLLRDQHQG
ncbi:MAG: DUF4301 family protein [Saprospiraceae bacterium]